MNRALLPSLPMTVTTNNRVKLVMSAQIQNISLSLCSDFQKLRPGCDDDSCLFRKASSFTDFLCLLKHFHRHRHYHARHQLDTDTVH